MRIPRAAFRQVSAKLSVGMPPVGATPPGRPSPVSTEVPLCREGCASGDGPLFTASPRASECGRGSASGSVPDPGAGTRSKPATKRGMSMKARIASAAQTVMRPSTSASGSGACPALRDSTAERARVRDTTTPKLSPSTGEGATARARRVTAHRNGRLSSGRSCEGGVFAAPKASRSG